MHGSGLDIARLGRSLMYLGINMHKYDLFKSSCKRYFRICSKMWDLRAEDGVPQACLEMVSSFIDEAADDERLGKCLIGFEIRFFKLDSAIIYYS